jgi:hypothetical protein
MSSPTWRQKSASTSQKAKHQADTRPISGILSLSTVLKRRQRGDSVSPGGRRRICGIPLPPPAALAAGGWGILRSALRRVDRGLVDGVAAVGWSASSFWCSAASPPWRRPRRRSQAAGTSQLVRLFLRRRRRARDGCTGGRSGRCKAAAASACGVLVEDLALVPDPEWLELGAGPRPMFDFVLKSSSVELVVAAALRRLWARSSSAPWVWAPRGCLRRLRRWRLRAAVLLEVGDGGAQRCCPLCFPGFPLLVSGLVMFSY